MINHFVQVKAPVLHTYINGACQSVVCGCSQQYDIFDTTNVKVVYNHDRSCYITCKWRETSDYSTYVIQWSFKFHLKHSLSPMPTNLMQYLHMPLTTVHISDFVYWKTQCYKLLYWHKVFHNYHSDNRQLNCIHLPVVSFNGRAAAAPQRVKMSLGKVCDILHHFLGSIKLLAYFHSRWRGGGDRITGYHAIFGGPIYTYTEMSDLCYRITVHKPIITNVTTAVSATNTIIKKYQRKDRNN